MTGLLTTTAGRQAMIADLAGGADLVITAVAWGDAGGVPYDPVETQVALTGERYRAGINAVAVVDGALVVDATIPADTPDASGRASHGFSVAEVGLYGTSGGVLTLLGVARLGNGYKPSPASGQAMIATYRLKLACANPSAIAVVIDPQAQIALGREVRPQWLTVDGVLNAPPGNPTAGATYVVGAAPTGAWAGFAGRLAQWIGVWSLAVVPDGHRVNDRTRAESDPLRELKYIGGQWVSAAATTGAYGVTRLATQAETAAAIATDRAVTPAGIAAGRTLRAPTTYAAPGAYVYAVAGYAVYLEGCAAGAGGAMGSAGTPGGAGPGGGAGAQGRKTLDTLPGDTLAITIPAGGLGGTNAAAPTAGGGLTIVHNRGGVALATFTLGGGQAGANAAAGVGGNSAAGGTPGAGWDQSFDGEPGEGGFVPSGGPAKGGRGGAAIRVSAGGLGGQAGSGNGNPGNGPGGGGGGGGGTGGSYATGGAGRAGAAAIWG